VDASSGAVVASLDGARESREVFSLAVHPTDAVLASGHADGTTHLWDLSARRHVGVLPGLTYRVTGLAFSGDGLRLASSGAESEIVLWDYGTRSRASTLPGSGTPWSVAFARSGSLVAAGTTVGTIDVWNVVTGARVASIVAHERLIAGLAFSQDGSVLASGSDDGLVKVWDAATYRELASFPTRHNEVTSLAFDPTRAALAAACQAEAALVVDFGRLDEWIEGQRAYQAARVAGERTTVPTMLKP